MLIQSKRFSLNDSIYCQVIALSLTLKKFRGCPGISFNLLLITFLRKITKNYIIGQLKIQSFFGHQFGNFQM